MATETDIRSDLAIAPGEYLQEVLADAGLSQKDLAQRTGRPAQAINEIIKGVKAITPDTAIQLETVLGVPAHIWTGLESEYRLALARQEEARALAEERPLMRKFPFKEMADIGWVAYTQKRDERIRELRRFFGVSSLMNVENVGAYAPAFRHAEHRSPSQLAVAAWIKGGEHDAKRIETAAFDRKKLEARVSTIRALVTNRDAVDAIARLRAVLAECGVALVLRPHLTKTYLTGATFWMKSQNKAVLMMSLRGKWADIFWFTLFHELCHILKHEKRQTFVDFEGVSTPGITEQEDEADAYAQEALIPSAYWHAFVSDQDFSARAIAKFAARVDTAPGIVTGRLRREEFIAPNRHDFRDRLDWSAIAPSGLGTRITQRFDGVGATDLETPNRAEQPRIVDFDG
ncbi:HigA family addiction module antitoxin [Salinisphaera sp. Q1T1-3]|uniref:HigA family addiction module antitoxin n=1 Tax=Salinisphaera sp. Q1T1-3 TaxID=2321229 RepID=UPI000E73036F|nr:HigA family addiction module antitoxin [Salinisphaera sp. Q1T1-3]RJS91150.1 addiction module antidote protein, HigA family [Salinisphaera sp. Q1T1-3]